MKKPFAIILAQIVIGAGLVLLVGGSAYWLHYVLARAPADADWSPVAITLELGARLLISGLFATALISLIRRSAASRWLGLVALMVVFSGCVWSMAQVKSTGLDVAEQEQRNAAYKAGYRTGGYLGTGLILLAFGGLVYAFGFSSRSRAFFAALRAASAGSVPTHPGVHGQSGPIV